jgi:type II secretory pathway component GspD/PulD (secretin)
MLVAQADPIGTVATTQQALGLQLPQGKRMVSISFQNVPMVQALKALALESQFNVVVDATITDRISIEFTDVPLEQVLLALKRVGQLHYSLHNGTLMVSKRDSAIAQALEQQQARIIHLRYTQAGMVAQLVNQTLQTSSSLSTSSTATSAAASTGNNSTSTSSVIADTNSNSLILKGDLTELLLAESLIAEIDKPRQSKTWHLSYANSVEVASFLASSVFNDNSSATPVSGGGSSATGAGGATGGGSTVPIKTETISEGTGGSALTPLSSGSSSSSSTNKIFTVRTQTQAEGQITITGNGPILLPDSRLNTLTVMGTPQQLDQVSIALETLDRKSQQIKLDVSVLEVSEGIEKLLNPNIASVINGKVGIGFDGAGPYAAYNRSPVQPSSQLTASLTLLDQQRKLKVLSNPSIIASHNQESIINIVDEVVQGFRTVTNQTGATIARVATVVNAGIVLNVLPKLGATGEVSLRVNPIISFPQPSSGGASSIRLISRRELVAQNVVLKAGESFVLGGLTQTLSQSAFNKIPGLADLPILGALFKGQNPNSSKTELLIIITPQWLDDNGQVAASTQHGHPNHGQRADLTENSIPQPFSKEIMLKQLNDRVGESVEIEGITPVHRASTLKPLKGSFISESTGLQQAKLYRKNQQAKAYPALMLTQPIKSVVKEGETFQQQQQQPVAHPQHPTELF